MWLNFKLCKHQSAEAQVREICSICSIRSSALFHNSLPLSVGCRRGSFFPTAALQPDENARGPTEVQDVSV